MGWSHVLQTKALYRIMRIYKVFREVLEGSVNKKWKCHSVLSSAKKKSHIIALNMNYCHIF